MARKLGSLSTRLGPSHYGSLSTRLVPLRLRFSPSPVRQATRIFQARAGALYGPPAYSARTSRAASSGDGTCARGSDPPILSSCAPEHGASNARTAATSGPGAGGKGRRGMAASESYRGLGGPSPRLHCRARLGARWDVGGPEQTTRSHVTPQESHPPGARPAGAVRDLTRADLSESESPLPGAGRTPGAVTLPCAVRAVWYVTWYHAVRPAAVRAGPAGINSTRPIAYAYATRTVKTV